MADEKQKSTTLVTGASGLVGRQLVATLEAAGHRVLRAVRREVRDPQQELSWDPAAGKIDRAKLVDVDAIVHLAGANIADRRWTPSYKQMLIDSRVQGTELIARTIADMADKPRVFACASAIGFYGNRDDEEIDESAPKGEGFLAELCLQWERACQPARDAGIRVANLRIGVVLSPEVGALAKMLLPFKLGLGGVVGNGRQYYSWITIDDVAEAMRFVLANDSLAGPVNLVSPQPVTNREFTKTLGQVLSRPTVFPMPAFAARTLFGEMADELLLVSARIVPRELTQAGFSFRHGELQPALQYLLGK